MGEVAQPAIAMVSPEAEIVRAEALSEAEAAAVAHPQAAQAGTMAEAAKEAVAPEVVAERA